MTGLYLGGPLVLLVLSLRFHFLLLRYGEAWPLSRRFSRWTDTGERWPVVPDGAGAAALPVASDTKSAMTTFETVLSTCWLIGVFPGNPCRGRYRRPKEDIARATIQ